MLTRGLGVLLLRLHDMSYTPFIPSVALCVRWHGVRDLTPTLNFYYNCLMMINMSITPEHCYSTGHCVQKLGTANAEERVYLYCKFSPDLTCFTGYGTAVLPVRDVATPTPLVRMPSLSTIFVVMKASRHDGVGEVVAGCGNAGHSAGA